MTFVKLTRIEGMCYLVYVPRPSMGTGLFDVMHKTGLMCYLVYVLHSS